MKKSGLIQETMSTRQTKEKKIGLEGEERKNMIGCQLFLKKLSIGEVVCMRRNFTVLGDFMNR